MATNRYTVNGGSPKVISDGVVDINMSTEDGVKAGCREYPIPLLNKITATSTEGALSKSTSIYAGYKVVEQLLGAIVRAGNYNTGTPYLSTIISIGRFGMFEPAHYDAMERWINHNMDFRQINSLINVGTGVKICVKIEYTKSYNSTAVVYVPIDGVDTRFFEYRDKEVPRYAEIGQSALVSTETVESRYIEGPERRKWFESVLSRDILNVNLSQYITEPDTAKDITVTLMAYIGSTPTANNTFNILPMNAQSRTSITCQFETYDPTIAFANKDSDNNYDTYVDGYGSVAEYNAGTEQDTTINISILPPA